MHKKIKYVICSTDISEKTDKQHKDMLKIIRDCIYLLNISNLKTEDYFIQSTYKNLQNKTQPCYLISKDGIKILIDKIRKTLNIEPLVKYYNDLCENKIIVLIPRKEIEFLNMLEEQLKVFNIYGERQYIVGTYRIDYYISKYRIAIEYDENNHSNYSCKKEKNRETYIKNELDCKFIRLNDKTTHITNCAIVINELIHSKLII